MIFSKIITFDQKLFIIFNLKYLLQPQFAALFILNTH